jgi:hypothetical protein
MPLEALKVYWPDLHKVLLGSTRQVQRWSPFALPHSTKVPLALALQVFGTSRFQGSQGARLFLGEPSSNRSYPHCTDPSKNLNTRFLVPSPEAKQASIGTREGSS